MKILLLLSMSIAFGGLDVHAKEGVTPKISKAFGEVVNVTIEFVDKPRSYYAQNIVKAKWFAKVKAVNGKLLRNPVIMEYRGDNDDFKKGSTLVFRAYEDIESSGVNREWDGVVGQFNYRISHFLRIRKLTRKATPKKLEIPLKE